MVPMGFCHICNKPGDTEYTAKNFAFQKGLSVDKVKWNLVETSVTFQDPHYWYAVIHCKENENCIKAMKASFAVWMVHRESIPYTQQMRTLQVNVLRTSGLVESSWTAVNFMLKCHDNEYDKETKKWNIIEDRCTVGMHVKQSIKNVFKVLPMWMIFFHNPSLTPADVVPAWPEYFPNEVKDKSIAELDSAYAKAKRLTAPAAVANAVANETTAVADATKK